MPSAPPLFIVLNAASGSDDARRAGEALSARLEVSGRTHQLLRVSRPDELGAAIGRAVLAAREARGVVVAAGGDGTMNAVAQAAWNADLPMGVLPLGTFNYFARAHDIPVEPMAALAALLNARVAEVPVGRVGERVFLVNASVGLYPRLLEQREQAKRRFGRHRLVALLSGLGSLLGGRSVLTLELHHAGQTRVARTRTLFVGNNRLQLCELGLPEALAVGRGRLAAITLQPLSMPRTLWLVLRGAVGRLDGAEGVDSFDFDHLVVRPRRAGRTIKVAVDGEVLRLPAPLVFETAPHPLRLLVPSGPRPAE
ncbi:MAG: diacylglycerol kinase [Proteobacteria bacterium]|jgi:diacylglycerol kinase family enzyme|nr:diacylglycerol kinase [Pseudomonadota bacterium]